MNINNAPCIPHLVRVLLVLLLAAPGLLCACADKEPEERAVLIAAIKNNLLSKSGMAFVALTEEQKKSMGADYTAQYESLGSLHNDRALEAKFSEFPKFMSVMMQESQAPEKKQILADAYSMIKDGRDTLAAKLAELQKKRTEFKQPEELAAVYGQAFEQLIGNPLNAVMELFDQCLQALDAARDLNDYILANPGSAVYKGNMVQIEAPEHEQKIMELFNTYRAEAEKINSSIQKLNAVVR
ncbi:DUF3053 family protein [Desulfovibrio sp. OttesenSCG-928-A18]|nr:DUF3053 family protein [Desulfovibrio sp. OttesenSCG-928-A18]